MQTYFFIRADRRYIKIRYDELIYVESLNNYVKIVCKNNTHMTLLSLRQLDEILPSELFCRINRSCIVSLDFIVAFDKESITLTNNDRVFFGNIYKGVLETKVNIVCSDVRKKPVAGSSAKVISIPDNAEEKEKKPLGKYQSGRG
jgi:hypothetical protein